MKKPYLVEVTSNEKWEMCSGFYLAMAETSDEAKEITKNNIHSSHTIVSVKEIKKLMDKKTFETIINPIVE